MTSKCLKRVNCLYRLKELEQKIESNKDDAMKVLTDFEGTTLTVDQIEI